VGETSIVELLRRAVAQGLISPDQARGLQVLAETLPRERGRGFRLEHVLYYLGGAVAIVAMTLFMDLGWSALGGAGVLTIALGYGAVGLLLARWLEAQGSGVAAGVCGAFVVALTPMAVYGFQQLMGWWPGPDNFLRHADGRRLYMGLATLAVGGAVFRRFRYSIVLMPVALALWAVALDGAALYGSGKGPLLSARTASLGIGLVLLGGAVWLEFRRSGRDFSFWFYLVGVLAFWAGLTLQPIHGELARLGYLLANLALIGLGAVLGRRLLMLPGGLGVILYLGHLASELFRDSWLFPVSLAALGLGVLMLGWGWQRVARRGGLSPVPRGRR